MSTISVRLNVNNQIEVTVGDESRVGECYYLGLQSDSAEDFDPRRGVLRLLRQWLDLLIGMRDGEQLFLPFDFSDEFTRWLMVQRQGDDLSLVIGWAAVEGWSISLDDISELARGVPEFVPDEPIRSHVFYRARVFGDLRRSIARLADDVASS